VQAKADAGTALADSYVTGMRSNGHGLTRAARQRLDDAQDHASACDVAVKSLATALPERRKQVERANYEVIKAARNVVRSEAPDLAGELKAAVDRVNVIRAQLYFCYRNAALPGQGKRSEMQGQPHPLCDLRDDSAAAEILRQSGAGLGHDENHAAFKSWELAFGALMQNADAKLPAVTDHAGPSP
jgi:hypothetical protein